MKKIEDEHLKAYHEGYEQGRFDVFAEQMCKDGARKDKQENCPYCHKPFKKWTDGYWDNCKWEINSYQDDGIQRYELLGQVVNGEFSQITTVTKLNYCLMCGRPLSKEANDER